MAASRRARVARWYNRAPVSSHAASRSVRYSRSVSTPVGNAVLPMSSHQPVKCAQSAAYKVRVRGKRAACSWASARAVNASRTAACSPNTATSGLTSGPPAGSTRPNRAGVVGGVLISDVLPHPRTCP
jgi:hypothetical protein